MNFIKAIASFILTFLFFSCNSKQKIDTLILGSPNLTSHLFDIPIQKLYDTTVQLFDKQDSDIYLSKIFYGGDYGGYRDPEQQHFLARSSLDSIPADYFNFPGRKNDIYLLALTNTWTSKIYFSNGKPLQFQASYILHFKELDKNHTLLSVSADDPFVVNGMDGIGVHGPKRKQVQVPPTTIEEYTLILFIASKLGEKNLPPLNLPKPSE